MGGHVITNIHVKVMIYIVAISLILKMRKINNNISKLEIYASIGTNVAQFLEEVEYLVCDTQSIRLIIKSLFKTTIFNKVSTINHFFYFR